MKKLIFLVLTLVTLICRGQDNPPSGDYTKILTTGYDELRMRIRALHIPTGGATPALAPRQWTAAGAVYIDSVNDILYFYSNETWHATAGGGAAPAGNTGDVQIKGLAFDTPLLDSLRWAAAGLTDKGKLIVGPLTATTNNSQVRITKSGTATPLLVVGPPGYNTNNAFSVDFNTMDSNVTSNSGVRTIGSRFNHQILMGSDGVTLSFKYGVGGGVGISMLNSVTLSSQNNDAFAAALWGMEFTKATGQTTRSVITSGATDFDHTQAIHGQVSFNGGTSTNNFIVNGYMAAFVSYAISTNPNHTDSIANWTGYYSGNAGPQSPYMGVYRAFFAAPGGGVPLVGKYYSFYGLSGTALQHQARFWNQGNGKFGGTELTADTALNGAKLEVEGPISMVDGLATAPVDTTNFKVVAISTTTGLMRKMYWPATGGSGGTDSPDRINGTATGPVTADMDGNNLIIQAVPVFNVRYASYSSGLLQVDHTNGVAYVGDWDGSVNSNYLTVNDALSIISVNLGSSGVFRTANLSDSTNYIPESYPSKAYVDDHIANAGSGGGSGDVVGPASATNTAISIFDGTTGKLLKNSLVTIGSSGDVHTPFVDVVDYGTATLIDNNSATSSNTSGLWFNTDVGTLDFRIAHAQGFDVDKGAGVKTIIRSIYGGNSSYWETGSAMSIYGSSGVATNIGANGTADYLKIGTGGEMTLKPMTATAASALTPAQGMIVCVSNTNGTFTAVGFWGYNGSAWTQF